ncbi:lytic transglycosylase domain-containing protein [Paenibacillus cymbidii]|uniref:lytic transglycosylase domain-containing protein n=1 Tax=Paenibacillus cymbidii TaxID=1639034 RepID=UPI0010808E3A|nr:lytic transglycosylase domain-containing protein [Paenibacillus cymbidii]
MSFFRTKRFWAIVLAALLLTLFYRSTWLGKLMYPIHYRDEIEAGAGRYAVDPLLIAAIIRVESNYKPEPRSRKGAVGLMQLMPDTAEWIFGMEDGLRNLTLDDLDDPAVNIKVGSKYVDLLVKQFEHNLAEVLAAYNAGQGNVVKWRQTGVWDGKPEHIADIPFAETRKYVDRVLYYYDKYVQVYSEQ